MDDQSKPQPNREAARRDFLKYVRRVLGKLSADEESFYEAVANREPDKVVDYLTAVKGGRSPDPAYIERFQSMRLDYGKRRVVRKGLDDDTSPGWENSLRCHEDGEGPAR